MIVYASSLQTALKPFSSFQGETFEFYDPYTDTKFLVESICNHPPTCAIYAENKNFKLESLFHLRSEFTLKSFCFYPEGKTIVTLKKTNEKFSIRKPYTSVHNMVIGETYLWNNGWGVCENLSTGHKAQVYFSPVGYFGSYTNKVKGGVTDEHGNETHMIEGDWTSFYDVIDINNGKKFRVVEKLPNPINYEQQYCMS